MSIKTKDEAVVWVVNWWRGLCNVCGWVAVATIAYYAYKALAH